jgi:protein-histidine pros-kinase
VGILGSAYVSRELLQRNAQAEILEHARLTMEKALAVRAYTSEQIRPLLDTQMKYTFLPQSIPAYSATEVLNQLAKKYPEYSYKEATLNPTNPRDRAVDWEVDIITRFRAEADLKEFIGQRDSPNGRLLYVARPLRIGSPACLICHSTVDAAPKTLLDRYGPANGFGWQLNEAVGAQIVSVPMAVPLARAGQTFKVFIGSLIGIFLLIGLVLNAMLWALVIRPITRLSKLADQVSLGDMEAPEFTAAAHDEIGILAESLARMRRSLEQALKMLETA